jgi:hypothetical protein
MKYNLTFKLVETEAEAKAFCEGVNSNLNRYAKRKYPATYHAHTIKDNDHKGNDWNGYLIWYRYTTC